MSHETPHLPDLADLLLSGPLPVAVIRITGEVVAMNRPARTYLDCKVLAAPWLDLWPEDDRPTMAATVTEAMLKGSGTAVLAWGRGRSEEHWELEIERSGDLLVARWYDKGWIEENALLRTAFREAVIGKAIVALDGSFRRVNPALCNLLGLSEPQLLATTFQAVTHPDDLEADLALLNALLEGSIPNYRMDKRYLRADGSVVWANLSVSLVRGQDGEPRFFVSQIHDISDRKAAEQALAETEARYRLMAEHSTDVIIATSAHGVITFASPSSAAVFGYAPEALVGRRFVDILHPDDLPALECAFREWEGNPPMALRWRFRHNDDGHWVWVESKPTTLPATDSDSPDVVLDVIREVTAQVAQEQALAAAKRDAEMAASAKAEFLANMSHEIRTPLTSVLGFAGLLAARSDLPPDAQTHVDRVRVGATTLLSLVNDILDFSKLEAGQVEIRPTPTSILGVLGEVLELFAVQVADKGISLELKTDGSVPPWLLVDGDRLRQIATNFVSNAVKFTATGGVSVNLTYACQTSTLTLAVEDSGPGLDPSQQARLFQRFSQIDGSATRRHGGTGLGLAICRGLAEAMGGCVWVRSAPDQGAVFGCEVPADIAAAPPQTPESIQAETVAGFRALVVDDHPVNRELVRLVLGGAGMEVSEAESGEEALRIAAKSTFDIILMDLTMPGMDGRSAARRLREAGLHHGAPILAFSAAIDVIEAGAEDQVFDGAIAKPLNPALLVGQVHAAIADHEAAPEAPFIRGAEART